MITLLDTIGPVVWRASWQAAALVVPVMLLLWSLGERLSPRWRFLLWGLVLARLLIVATPAAPWSLFNLVRWHPEASQRSFVPVVPNTGFAPPTESVSANTPPGKHAELPQAVGSAPDVSAVPASGVESRPSRPSPATTNPPKRGQGSFNRISVARILSAVYMAGCLLLVLRLSAAALVLRRRLSACRRVTDASLLNLLDTCCREAGLKRPPTLLVTPSCLSPCVVGTWNPRIVIPESVVTQSSPARLRHVMAHELAHLVRGDLWTNWLLLVAPILHWFNPVAWWTVSQMQAEREAACDELAFSVLGETDRRGYAATMVDFVLTLSPSPLAPGLIGLFSSADRVQTRVERFLRSPSVVRLPAPVVAVCLLAIALSGLTDANSAATDPSQTDAAPPDSTGAQDRAAAPKTGLVTLRGRCVDSADGSGMAGVRVRLFKAEGRMAPIVEAARTATDDEGHFEFANFVPPRPHDSIDRLVYLLFAEADNRPLGVGGTWTLSESDPFYREIRILRDSTTFAGTIFNSRREPIAGATIAQWDIDGREVPGVLSATTGADGRFEIKRIPDLQKALGREIGVSFTVSHQDYPLTNIDVAKLPADLEVILPDGCLVAGTVADSVTGRPAEGAVVIAINDGRFGETPAVTGADGRFRMVLADGRYTFRAEAHERVCVALVDRECPAGEKVELPSLKLIGGGFISGRVINTETGKPVAESDARPIVLGLSGPTHPPHKVSVPARLADVDASGRFTLRAAPGDNFPYFVNIRGDRMCWDTLTQPPVTVKEGETTEYDMLITPIIPPEEKLKAARKLVDSLPKKPSDRTKQILLEFRKLNHTVDETERWCLLMRELVAVGRDAVPQVCAELDRTTENRMLRRLAFALRAIGDPRAVPALIRAIPKTLLPSSSDYGLIVADKGLADFMQMYDLGAGRGGTYFDLGRPVREIFGALHVLTHRNPHDSELFDISLSEDRRRQVLQRRIYVQHALRWQAWWEENWRTFTDDAAYAKVTLDRSEEPVPPAPNPESLPKTTRLAGEMTGAVLSPAIEQGAYAWHFYDLDTGFRPEWPTGIGRDEASLDAKELRDWAFQMGVDLMCVTRRSPDGTETYVLRALGMKVWEMTSRDLRNFDKFLAAGTLPEGSPVDELLMHYDPQSDQLVPDANAVFLFITREGNMGVIETTDRVTRVADLTGMAGPPPGVGFHKGVRFNLFAIIP